MLHVTSWYDIFGEGGPSAYQSIKANSRFEKARNGQRLIIGPWGHLLPYNVPSSRGTGDIDFGPTALIDLNETLLRWFDYWLKDIDNGIMDEPPVTVFTLGENRWQKLSAIGRRPICDRSPISSTARKAPTLWAATARCQTVPP